MPVLLDAVRHAETGHLSLEDARNARSPKGAIGPYQFLEKNLHDMGYKMPMDISPVTVRDPALARDLAERYISGYSSYHGFTTPLQKLAAYNMGPAAAEAWLASGGRIEDLPQETKEYVRRAAAFLNKQQPGAPEETTAMAMMNDGYDLMRQLGYNEAEITAAKRKGVPAEFYEAKQGFDQGVLTESPMQLAIANSNTPLRGKAGVLNNAPVLDVSVRPDTRGAPTVDMLQAMRLEQERNQATALANNMDQFKTDNQLRLPSFVTPAAASTTQNNMQYSPITPTGSSTGSSPMPVNRRDQSPMAMPQAPSGIDMNEMLIRVGAAGLGGSARGGLEAFQAMGQEYGRIKDAERRAGLDAYKSQMTLMGKKGKTRPGGNPVSPYNAVVLDTLNDIIPALDGDTSWFSAEAGLPGAILRAFPGSPATDFAAKLDTLKANIGFDRLQKMRDESPTGGALGQVSEMELRQLNAALGSLDQNQSPQQLQENLLRIRDHYIRAVSALEAEYAAAGIDISSKIQPMGSGGQGMGVGQEMTINGVTVKRIN